MSDAEGDDFGAGARPEPPRSSDIWIVGLLLLLTIGLRAGSFALVHDRGDELLWAGVAENLATRGPVGYTVRGIDLRGEDMGKGATLVHFEPQAGTFGVARPGAPEVAPVGSGMLLDSFVASGEKYWDSPLFNQPPGFLLVLLGSHALLGTPGDGFPLVARDPRLVAEAHARVQALFEPKLLEIQRRSELPAEEQKRQLEAMKGRALDTYDAWENRLARQIVADPPPGIMRAQLWAVLPGLVSDMLAVAILYLFLRSRLGRTGAILAAVAYTTDPLGLFCAHRLLSNGPLATACLAALALEEAALAAEGARRTRLSVGVGLLVGFAITIKVSAVFLLPAVLFGRILRGQARDVSLAVLLLVALILATPWWVVNTYFFGNPLGAAWRKQVDFLEASEWGRLVTFRGPMYYARVIGRSPLVVLGAVAGIARLVAAAHERWTKGASTDANLAGALFAGAVLFFASIFEAKEARHLLLAYPPLLLEAARALVAVHKGKSLGLAMGAGLGVAAIVLWQASVGLGLAFDVARAP